MATIYGGTNDGYCGHGLGTWSNMRNGAGNLYKSNGTYNKNAVWHFYNAARGSYGIYRSFFEFDTSGITIAPSDAVLRIYGITEGGGDVIAVKSEHGGTLSSGDFNSFSSAVLTALGNTDGNGAGTLAGISGFAYSAEIATWSTSGYNNIALNATALSDMVSLDTFKVCLMNHDNDYLDQDSTSEEKTGMYYADNTGTSKDPYIDYTPGVAVTDNSIFFGTNF